MSRRRYYSHYTFIYPNIQLKNFVITVEEGRIIDCFRFEKEIENTEFYSNLLVFLPENIDINTVKIQKFDLTTYNEMFSTKQINNNSKLVVYHEGRII